VLTYLTFVTLASIAVRMRTALSVARLSHQLRTLPGMHDVMLRARQRRCTVTSSNRYPTTRVTVNVKANSERPTQLNSTQLAVELS